MSLKYAQVYTGEKNHGYTTGMPLKPFPHEAFQLIEHHCLLARPIPNMQRLTQEPGDPGDDDS